MNKCIPEMGKDVVSALESMQEELDRVKAERDAAVEDLQIHGGCGICKHGYYEPVMGGFAVIQSLRMAGYQIKTDKKSIDA